MTMCLLWFIVDVAPATPWRYKLYSVKCGCGMMGSGETGGSGVDVDGRAEIYQIVTVTSSCICPGQVPGALVNAVF